MSNESDNNYVSVGAWMWMMFVTALPVIGWIMIIVWAFTGDNESRKNYFRAILMWFVVLLALIVGLALTGQLLGIKQRIQDHHASVIPAATLVSSSQSMVLYVDLPKMQ